MPRSKRPEIAIAAELILLERRAVIGTAIKEARLRRRWTQTKLGKVASLSRSIVARIERAETRLDIEVLQRLALALDVPLIVDLGRDPQRDVADAGHLAIQELVLRLARHSERTRRFELPTKPSEPWRSADIAIGTAREHAAVDIECWNTFGDFGAATRSSHRKIVELAELAVAAWGPDARATCCWVVRATKRNREIVAKYPEVFARAFPGSSAKWVAALTRGGPIPTEAGLVWCDVRATRLFAWRKR